MQPRRKILFCNRSGPRKIGGVVLLAALLAGGGSSSLSAAPTGIDATHFPLYESQHPDEVADTVILKSGKVFTNVKTFPRGGVHTIKFQNGRAISVPNAKIKIVRIKGVSWKSAKKKRKRIAAVVKKRKPRRQAPPQVAGVTPRPRVQTRPRPRIQPVPRPRPQPQPPRKPVRELQATKEDKQEKPKPSEKGWELGPVTKSLLVPGWGQYSMGHDWRAAGIVTLSLPIVYNYFNFRNEHTDAQAAYSDQILPGPLAQPNFSPIGTPAYYTIIEQRRSVLLRKEDQTNSMVFALIGLWGLQTLDAYYLNLRNGGKDPFFRSGRKLGFTSPSPGDTNLIAFSDGRNFIFGIGLHF